MSYSYELEDVFICKECSTATWFDCCADLICPECGGEMIYTGSDDDEWSYRFYDVYHRDPQNGFELFEFVTKEFLKDTDYDLEKHQKVYNSMIEEAEQITREYNSKPHCPKCGSTNLGKTKRGFKWGRAIATAAVTGFVDVAAAAGGVGSNKMINCCNDCGHTWK